MARFPLGRGRRGRLPLRGQVCSPRLTSRGRNRTRLRGLDCPLPDALVGPASMEVVTTPLWMGSSLRIPRAVVHHRHCSAPLRTGFAVDTRLHPFGRTGGAVSAGVFGDGFIVVRFGPPFAYRQRVYLFFLAVRDAPPGRSARRRHSLPSIASGTLSSVPAVWSSPEFLKVSSSDRFGALRAGHLRAARKPCDHQTGET